MAIPTLDDQVLLNQLFRETMSPIANYSQGALQIAIADRARREQEIAQSRRDQVEFQRQQQQSALILAREQEIEKIRQQAETKRQEQEFEFKQRLEKAAQERADTRQKAEWEHADKTHKEDILDKLKGEAAERGIALPDSKLSPSEQFDQLHRAIGANDASKAMSLLKAGRNIQSQIDALTASSAKERGELAVSSFLRSPAASALTADEQKQLKDDPSKFFGILARLKTDKSKKGKMAADAAQEAWFQADTESREFFLSKVKEPEKLAAIRAAAAQQSLALHAALSNPNLPSGLYEHMFDGIVDEAKKIGEEQKVAPPGAGAGAGAGGGAALPLPPPKTSPTGGGTAAAAPAAALPQRIPSSVIGNPYQTLLGFMRSEQRDRTPLTAFTGNSPFAISTGPTPATDLFHNELGQMIGLQPQQVGSSVFMRSPGAQVEAGLNNPAMVARLDALSPEQQNQAAFRVLNQIWSDPNNPTRARFVKWLQDNQATQNAIAPTAFPAMPSPGPVNPFE